MRNAMSKVLYNHAMSEIGYIVEITNISGLGYWPIFRATVNKKPTTQFFIPAALDWSVKNEGIFPVLNCSCGTMGCGGNYIKVRHAPRKIIWEKIIDGQSGGEDSPTEDNNPIVFEDKSKLVAPLEFEREQYEQTVKKLLSEPEFKKYEKEIYLTEIKSYEKGDFFYI